MTSSHLVHIDCEGVEQLVKESRISFVYFGNEEDIFEGGKMAHIQQMASADRFIHPEEPITFYFNTDPQCKKDRMFAPDEPAVALYCHSEVLPFTLQAPDDDLSFERLVSWISISITQFSLKWGSRSHSLIEKLQYNSLVYLMPEINERSGEDFTAMIMGQTANTIREHIQGVVAIITQYDDPYLPQGVPQMREILEVTDKDDLPGLWLIHGHERTHVKYPYDLSTKELSPELLLLWSRGAILDIELPKLEEYVVSLENNDTVEMDLLEHYQKRLEQGADERKMVKKNFEEVQRHVKEAVAEIKKEIEDA